MYLIVDSTSNIVQWAGESMPTSIPSDQVLATIADNDPNAQGVLSRPTDYTYSGGKLARRPYFTLAYDHTAGVLTATLNEAPTPLPTSVTFTVAGQSISATPTTGTDATGATVVTAQASIRVHPSLVLYSVPVTVTAPGFVDGQIDVGNSYTQPPVQVQAFQPSGQAYWMVAPTGAGSKAFLAEYWSSTVEPAYTLGDIATMINLLCDAVFGVLFPAVNPSLNTDQQNAYNDIKKNVLPNILTTLANIAPVPANGQPQSYDIHYQRALVDLATTKTAMEGYVNDVQSIPNLE